MKPMQIAMALLSAVMFFILAGVFMGVQLELNGTKLVVDTAADIRWQWIFIGTAVVFFFQLLRPLFQKAVKNVSGPKFIMPAIDGSTVKQKLFLIALLVAQHQQLKTGLFSGLLKTPAFRRAQSEALDRAATWLERIGLLEHANRQASNLAYGDQRRLEIARCMVTQPEILMLDEPAAGLNPKETKELDELIAELRNHHNTTILLIEHDMKLVMGISDRIYVVNQGTPLANGTPEEIRNNPDVIRAYLGEA